MQFFNKIITGIGNQLAPELGGVGKILGGFDLVNNLRGKAEGLLGLQEAIKCVAPSTANKSSIWCLGKGPMNMPGVAGEAIMSRLANAAQSIQEAASAPGWSSWFITWLRTI